MSLFVHNPSREWGHRYLGNTTSLAAAIENQEVRAKLEIGLERPGPTGLKMGCCYPKPKPNHGDIHSTESSKAMPRHNTSFDLDREDRGTQVTVFVGRHLKACPCT